MAPVDRPLAGRGVLVTRPPGQGEELVAALERLGAHVHRVPMIEVHKLVVQDAFYHERLEEYDWIVLTSANAARIFLEEVGDARGDFTVAEALSEIRKLHRDRCRVAAVGPATKAEFDKHTSIGVELTPSEHHAEALLAELRPRVEHGMRVLIPRAKVARDVLPDGLRAAGCRVDVVPIYETRAAGRATDELRALFDARRIDAVTFTSSSTVDAFQDMVPFPLPAGVIFAAIGPTTADTVRAHGLAPLVVARDSTAASLVEALVQRFSSP